MGYQVSREAADRVFEQLGQDYDVFAPKVFAGEGCFSDTDVIRYGKVNTLDEIEWARRSDYSFKEVLLAVNETLFYFTENETTVPSCGEKKILIFLKSCDLHALKRLDTIYLENGPEDFYYKRLREKASFVLMGCSETCENGFCASMGTNRSEDYDLYLRLSGETVSIDCKDPDLQAYFEKEDGKACDVTPGYVTENAEKVTLPKNLSVDSFAKPIWEEYGSRFFGCGRGNLVFPTC